MSAIDSVRVRNIGSQPFKGAYDNRPYLIPPGEERFLDREAIMIHTGDWLLRGEERRNEYRRVRGKYGCLPGEAVYEMSADGTVITVPSDQVWESRRPRLEVTELDGTICVLPIDDPDGTSMPIKDSTDEDKERMLARMQAQIDRMQAELERERQDARQPTVIAPEDTPANVTSRKPRRASAEPFIDSEV